MLGCRITDARGYSTDNADADGTCSSTWANVPIELRKGVERFLGQCVEAKGWATASKRHTRQRESSARSSIGRGNPNSILQVLHPDGGGLEEQVMDLSCHDRVSDDGSDFGTTREWFAGRSTILRRHSTVSTRQTVVPSE